MSNKLINNQPLTGDFSSDARHFRAGVGLSISSFITGTPVGTLYFEGSNDETDRADEIDENSWIEITPYTEDIIAAEDIMTWIDSVRCKWTRMRYDFTSGSGFITSTYYTSRN